MKREEQRHCLECGQEVYGRLDKVFCTESCRNRFNNRRVAEGRKRRNRIIGILDTNYAILERLLNESDRTSYTLEELISTGYNLSYVTGQRKTPQSRDERRCFDIVYYQTPNRIFNLHKVKF